MFSTIVLYFVVIGIFVGSVVICKVSGHSQDDRNKTLTVPKSGGKIMINDKMTFKQEDCFDHEEEVHVFKNKSTSYRLASCPKSKEWATDSVAGIINNRSREYFNLESVSLKCNVTSSSHNQFEVHTVLEVTINTTATWKPFDRADIIIICRRNDSQKKRYITSYNMVYDSARGTGNSSDIDINGQQGSEKTKKVPDKKIKTGTGLSWLLIIPFAIMVSLLCWMLAVVMASKKKAKVLGSEGLTTC